MDGLLHHGDQLRARNRSGVALNGIAIDESQRDRLKRHAELLAPEESCAMLLGTSRGNMATVGEIIFAANAQKSRTSFAISHKDVIECYGRAEQKNMQMVGIFHSHPDSPAVPSKTDERFMLVNPVAWVIYSGLNGDFRAYVSDQRTVEIAII